MTYQCRKCKATLNADLARLGIALSQSGGCYLLIKCPKCETENRFNASQRDIDRLSKRK